MGEVANSKNNDYSSSSDDQKSNSIHVIMRPDGSGEFVKVSEKEKKNTKKRLIFKDFDNFPEDEEAFEEESKAMQKKSKHQKENKVINQ